MSQQHGFLLNPAVTQLMQTMTALLKLNEDSTEEDGDIVEVYLLFCNNIASVFEEVVKKLESNETTCVELYSCKTHTEMR